MSVGAVRVEEDTAVAINAVRDGTALPAQMEFLATEGIMDLTDSAPRLIGPVAEALRTVWEAQATLEVAMPVDQGMEWLGSLSIADDEATWVTPSSGRLDFTVFERAGGFEALASQLITVLTRVSPTVLWIVRRDGVPEEWLVMQERGTYLLVRPGVPTQAEADGLDGLAEALAALAEAR